MATETSPRTAPGEMPEDPTDRPPPGRAGMPAGRVVVVVLTCLLVWGLLYAPELKRSSEAQPEGLRRSVSLAVLSPIVWVEDRVGITAAVNEASRGLGRDPNAAVGGSVGGIPVGIDQIPSAPGGSKPGRHVVRDTPIRVPTGQNPLRVAVVGDSLAAGVGFFAERVFRPSLVNVIKQGRISTGLSRPDYFNWPAQMQLIVDRARPDLTIVMLGENDQQSLRMPGGQVATQIGTPGFGPAYAARVTAFAKIATSDGGHVVWIGLPNSRDPRRWPFARFENQIYQNVAEVLPNVAYFDTWDAFAGANGGYTAYYRDGNKLTLVRADDGVHFNSDGYTILMRRVAQFAGSAFQLDPKTYG